MTQSKLVQIARWSLHAVAQKVNGCCIMAGNMVQGFQAV
jgi:hypothetical protein